MKTEVSSNTGAKAWKVSRRRLIDAYATFSNGKNGKAHFGGLFSFVQLPIDCCSYVCNNTHMSKHPAKQINDRDRQRILRDLFIHHSGKCHWCSCNTSPGVQFNGLSFQATIDHLKTIRQGRKTYRDGGFVLACRKCNGSRNCEEIKEHKKRKIDNIQFRICLTFPTTPVDRIIIDSYIS
jgi:hypothetical protein